jgi:hypothetical protein
MELLAAGIPLTLLIDLAFGVTPETLDQVSASPELAGTRTHATYLNPQANAELVEAAMSRYLAAMSQTTAQAAPRLSRQSSCSNRLAHRAVNSGITRGSLMPPTPTRSS